MDFLTAVRARDPRGGRHCVRLLDEFEHPGPHGAPHVCEVFSVLGGDLLTLMKCVGWGGVAGQRRGVAGQGGARVGAAAKLRLQGRGPRPCRVAPSLPPPARPAGCL